MNERLGPRISVLRWALPSLGFGLLLAAASSHPAAAQNADPGRCKMDLQACTEMAVKLQQQRDGVISEHARCETSLKEIKLQLDLLRKAQKPGGLTHLEALALLELSMNILEKAPNIEISPADLDHTNRSLRLYQQRSTGLSLKLTEKANKANQRAGRP